VKVDVELVADVHCEVGEGPAWDPRDGSLLWVDIVPGHIYRMSAATGELTQITLGQEVSVAIPRTAGGYVVGVQDGLIALDRVAPGYTLSPLVEIELDMPGNLMNDCKCDTRGRLWGGTRARDWTPELGSLYRVEPDLTVTRFLDHISVSNGLGWSPDGTLLYYVDSRPGTLDVLDYDMASGTASGRRRFADIPSALGSPDGLCVDVEGCVWLAVLGTSALYRYAPDGSIADIVELPTAQPTSCCFGGADLGELYVTSAAVDMSESELAADPHAGGVFVLEPGVDGLPTVPFAG
jgi:sugar lactone lactonase YvrE